MAIIAVIFIFLILSPFIYPFPAPLSGDLALNYRTANDRLNGLLEHDPELRLPVDHAVSIILMDKYKNKDYHFCILRHRLVSLQAMLYGNTAQ